MCSVQEASQALSSYGASFSTTLYNFKKEKDMRARSWHLSRKMVNPYGSTTTGSPSRHSVCQDMKNSSLQALSPKDSFPTPYWPKCREQCQKRETNSNIGWRSNRGRRRVKIGRKRTLERWKLRLWNKRKQVLALAPIIRTAMKETKINTADTRGTHLEGSARLAEMSPLEIEPKHMLLKRQQ